MLDTQTIPTTAEPIPAPSSLVDRVRVALFGGRRRRFFITLAVVVGTLVAVNILRKFGPVNSGLIAGPIAAGWLLLLARKHGLSWHDLGLSRRTWARGALYALASVMFVGGVYALGVALPFSRDAFIDMRYQLHPSAALMTAFVFIPLGTILLEEVAFRGVLFGLVGKHRGVWWASGVSSMLFGAWHILSSLKLGDRNQAVIEVFGTGGLAKIAILTAVVLFTGLAGLLLCELRRRSGSLLAAAGLHWATNGLGVIAVAGLWALST